jgi:hypothetical protein
MSKFPPTAAAAAAEVNTPALHSFRAKSAMAAFHPRATHWGHSGRACRGNEAEIVRAR